MTAAEPMATVLSTFARESDPMAVAKACALVKWPIATACSPAAVAFAAIAVAYIVFAMLPVPIAIV
jgi:hypothetical protein